MRLKVLKISVLVFFLCAIFTQLHAQSSLLTAGGDASGGGGSVSYSLGQLVFNKYTGTGGSIIQGVQQPYEISVISAIEGTTGILLKCIAYPNPTTDFLKLKIENFNKDKLYYLLIDLNGKILKREKIEEDITQINMSNLVQATYFLKVIQENQDIKTFKIIKK